MLVANLRMELDELLNRFTGHLSNEEKASVLKHHLNRLQPGSVRVDGEADESVSETEYQMVLQLRAGALVAVPPSSVKTDTLLTGEPAAEPQEAIAPAADADAQPDPSSVAGDTPNPTETPDTEQAAPSAA